MTPSPDPKQAVSPAEVLQIDALAQEIRRVDGNHSLGAGALAEALWPYVRALRQGGEAWRPMDSAPKDGTPILVWFDKPGLGVLRVTWECPWGEDDPQWAIWCVDDNKHGPYALRGYSEGDAKGWRPLPQPPHSAGDTP